MPFRTFMCSLPVLALTLASVGSGQAAFLPRSPEMSGQAGQPVVLAQMSDPRIIGLEEQMRELQGRVEELNFQILQMQDQMRRMQEDNEFRFQQLEGGSPGSAGAAPEQRTEGPAVSSGDSTAATGTPEGTAPTLGEPPRTLGTITLDENGNVVSSGPGGEPIDLLQGGDPVVAALPSDNPDELYRNAYEFILSGDYSTAEAGFRQYLDQFPDGEHAADASFWLGEALLGQDRHQEAAEVFLDANRTYPDAKKAPEMLLKLGASLAAMGQHDVACATFTEIGHRYPGVSEALKERVRQEQASASC